MANNTNPEAIKFCNTKVRPVADAIVTMYLSLKTLIEEWNGENVVSIIPNDANLVQDGATVASGTPDGRQPITDGQVNVLVANGQTIINLLEASSNLILNQTMQVQVNGRSVI